MFFKIFTEIVRVIAGDEPVAAAQCIGVVVPVYEGSDTSVGFSVSK